MSDEIRNRVAESGIINLDPADFYPKENILELDIKPWLFQGLLLKEKDFRKYLADHDWSQYHKKSVGVYCSQDAIIPQWAYMLLASYLNESGARFYVGKEDEVAQQILVENIASHEYKQYADSRIIIKGCGEYPIPDRAYLELTKRLTPLAKSVMYGEACSTVPIYKKKK